DAGAGLVAIMDAAQVAIAPLDFAGDFLPALRSWAAHGFGCGVFVQADFGGAPLQLSNPPDLDIDRTGFIDTDGSQGHVHRVLAVERGVVAAVPAAIVGR